MWILSEKGSKNLLGILVVYVDDFLLQTKEGQMRDAFLGALSKVWTLDKEEILKVESSITFLGIEIYMRKNGDILLHQRKFIEGLLEKYGMSRTKGNSSVQIDKLPQEDIPTPAALRHCRLTAGSSTGLQLALGWISRITHHFLPQHVLSTPRGVWS